MVYFLVDPTLSRKTEALYTLAKKRISEGRRVLFFVPEQQTAACESDLVRLCQNRTGELLEVLNFQRLPNRIFREVGGLAVPTVKKTQKALLVALLLEREREKLVYYSHHARRAPFIKELCALFDELTRSGQTPESLDALAHDPSLCSEASLVKKLSDIALLFAEYRTLYRETCGTSPDEQVRLTECFSRDVGTDFFRDATVIFDDFYDFTAPQYELIRQIALAADEVYLSVLDDGKGDTLFARPRAAMRHLQTLIPPEGYRVISPEALEEKAHESKQHDDLSFLCRHILTSPDTPFETAPKHLSLTLAKTPYEEVREALRQVLLLKENEGVDPSDCAILYREKSIYAPLLSSLAEEFAVPLYTDERIPLIHFPAARFFLCAAALGHSDADGETFSALLETGLCPITREDALHFSRYIRTWNLHGKALLTTDDYHACVFGFSDLLTPEMKAENEEILARINRAKRPICRAVRTLRAVFDKARCAEDFVEALFDFAEEMKLCRTLSEEINRHRKNGAFSKAATSESLFGVLKEALTDLSDLKGPLSKDMFAQLLELAFSFGEVGALPSSPDALSAGDLSFVRLKKIRHLFLLGMNTDLFPTASAPSCVLSAREREVLSRFSASALFFAKSSIEVTMEEYFLFYLACAAPHDALHLFCHRQGLDAKNAEPSVLWRRVQMLFPHLKEQEADEHALPVCTAELYESLCRMRDEDDDLTRAAKELYTEKSALSAPKSILEEAEARDRISPSDADFLSVSQAKLESYARCPYRYFLQYVLFLREEARAETDASLSGSIVHSVMEHLLTPLCEGRFMAPKLETLTPDAVREEFQKETEKLSETGYRITARDRAMLDDLCRSTERLVASVRRELTEGKFRPSLFEVNLSRELKPLRLPLSEGRTATVQGMADRIDLFRDPETNTTYARVIDYKTGEHTFDLNAICNGFDTQLLLYLFTLQENGLPNTKEGEVVLPAGAYYLHSYAKPHAPDEKERAKLAAGDAEDYISFKRSGIFLNDPKSLGAMKAEGTPDSKDTPVKEKNGVYSARSGLVANEEEFEILKNAVLRYAADTAEDILDGRFVREPIREDEETTTGCEYCPYLAVCRYDGESCRKMKKVEKAAFFDTLKEGGIHRG